MGSQSLLVPTVIALSMLAIGVLGALRRFPFRHWAGLRTKATISSPAAWESAHLRAAPWMLAGGVGGLVVSAMLSHVAPGAHTGATGIAMGVDAVFLVAATVVAQRAASRVRAAAAGRRDGRQDDPPRQ